MIACATDQTIDLAKKLSNNINRQMWKESEVQKKENSISAENFGSKKDSIPAILERTSKMTIKRI